MSAVDLKNLGNELFKKGEFSNAWEKYDAAVKLDPKNALFLGNRAQCELKLEQFGSAVETCNKALEIDPQFVKCYFRRAIAYGGMLDFSNSARDFQQVVALAPDFAEGWKRLRAAQALVRYLAFQKAIKADEEPSILDKLDIAALPADRSEKTDIELDLDNITMSTFQNLVAHFKAGKRLPRPLLFDVIKRAATIFRKEPTMTEITVEKNDKITVCGDTHGQFYDLVNIFETNGWPSEHNLYLFNGDFVDRGSWSTEIAILLYVLKIKYPQSMFINRGNHETDSMNTTYGFAGECKAKYISNQVYTAFSESFALLPLACLINDDYFVVHGGLFSKPGVTLDDIRKVDRFASKQPPMSGLVMEMLWSDPRVANGIGPSRRGIAHEFGPDVTKEFTELNGLKAIIRSHEVRQDGYEEEHDGRLITIFSAPNYCDNVGNRGACINIDADSKMEFVQFDAAWHPDVPPMAYASNLMR